MFLLEEGKVAILKYTKNVLFFLTRSALKRISVGKESFGLQCMRPWFNSWVRKTPWRRDRLPVQYSWASLVAQTVKDLPAMW